MRSALKKRMVEKSSQLGLHLGNSFGSLILVGSYIHGTLISSLRTLDMDGKDDYIVIGNDTGSVTVWINGGPTADGWGWNGPHEVAPGALPPGGHGRDVFFADINGKCSIVLRRLCR